ncbi:helix-turn-helix transcriptional regulator [Streptomyces sp. H27-H1]|uniref:helix-turn-helix domain-containing protein n=1 Tax=Streptomyces sp. H27-H1 TaxID=2996461 RepID=UPI00227152A4|nr:helix-turn-helix transcriptional regulator [Streptomyces sp. H27-H1]MCY0926282.1 helix-turn-helix transcriptional regulator [Streptomyces sp. H27-H1]
MSAPSVRRRRLGAELRALRERHGLKLDDVAGRMGHGWDGPRLSRVERAALGIKPDALAALLDIYAVADIGRRDVLMSLARDGARRGWWQTYRDIISPAYAELISLEADAKSLRSYQTLLVPGLLQTASYARASISAINMGSSTEQVNALVEVRMARQSVLSRPEPLEVWAIIHEAALRPAHADSTVMRDQCQRLLDLMDLPHVSIQIVPLTAPPHPGMAGPFTVLGFPESADLDVVLVEHLASALYVEDAADVSVYGSAFEHLRAHALPFDRSADLTARIKQEHS